jgi:outer membrane protein OmpA-like peptidoglycan-associated protein
MGTRFRFAAALCALVVGATGCGLFGGDDGGGGGESGGGPSGPAYPEGPLVREGTIGFATFDARISVRHVERWDDRSVLRFTVSALSEDDDRVVTLAPFGSGALDRDHTGFKLVDPVNQRFYDPVRDAAGEATIGSEIVQAWVVGAEYDYEVHFPPLPEDVDRVTLITYGTTGEFTGVPVVDGEPPADPPSGSVDADDIAPGDTVEVPLRAGEMTDEPEDYARDLYAVTETTSEVRTSTPEEENIALHADVLFDFDEATLTPEAEEVLAGVVEETRENADPSQPPITIVGHTDGRGSDDYNQDLSERRAQAVRDVLAEGLGTDYAYVTEGRGAEEPVAEEGGPDDEEARAANRRVEVSYRIREPGAAESAPAAGETAAADARGGTATAPPAPFRAEDGDVVATAEAGLIQGNAEYELGVRPFYRDGAYLVGVFDLTHLDTGGSVPFTLRPLNLRSYPGGRLTGFGVTVPGDDATTYRAVRIGERPTDELDDARYLATWQWPLRQGEDGTTERVFAYFPAPPAGAEAVTLDAGPFGTFEDVPID